MSRARFCSRAAGTHPDRGAGAGREGACLGRPFTDPSGVRLREWLGVDEATFYDPSHMAILPMGFCFPGLDAKGSDLPPRPECAPAWRAVLMAEMPQVELVICLGAHAMRWHMGQAWSALSTRRYGTGGRGSPCAPPVIPLPHPSGATAAG